MTPEGFCTQSNQDEPVGATGFCQLHNHVAIPPSFGKREQRWTSNGWEPPIPKPEGWVYTPKFVDPPKTSIEPATYTCTWCAVPFTWKGRGTPPSYCTAIHRSAALNARRREARKAAS